MKIVRRRGNGERIFMINPKSKTPAYAEAASRWQAKL